MLGLYLDQLTDEERDRVIAGQGWAIGKAWVGGDRCLVGHIEQWAAGGWTNREAIDRRGDWESPRQERRGGMFWWSVPTRFDRLAARVGLDRAVRLVKMRAARVNRVSLAPTAPEMLPSLSPAMQHEEAGT